MFFSLSLATYYSLSSFAGNLQKFLRFGRLIIFCLADLLGDSIRLKGKHLCVMICTKTFWISRYRIRKNSS
ncbi:hypothetical protein HOLleu_17487 [Holothuria leucospilota]|uniref:Uncharacterized protein n=1 Tax=Holothuria leucospilota TaxID=206669 RepID=A0A9Q1C0G7_HOLLE|nr:hypothetical protein HOLleu_17487 [Holothuria leucospilota]